MSDIEVVVSMDQVMDQLDNDSIVKYIGCEELIEEMNQKELTDAILKSIDIDPFKLIEDLLCGFSREFEFTDTLRQCLEQVEQEESDEK